MPISAQRRDNQPARGLLPRGVIGSDGVIVYAEVNPDYTHRPDPSELLPVLDRLRASKAA